jgi:NTP pyrophosphatase (non-canonical NTP hydrolase)
MNNQNNTLHANLVYNKNSNVGIAPAGYNPTSKLIINVNERIMKYNELESLVIAWATQKAILEKGTPAAQCDKTLEEVYELHEAIKNNDREEIIDALGDILVTIIIQAEMQGLKLEDCLQSAYNVISKRKGQMIDGQFVKEK